MGGEPKRDDGFCFESGIDDERRGLVREPWEFGKVVCGSGDEGGAWCGIIPGKEGPAEMGSGRVFRGIE